MADTYSFGAVPPEIEAEETKAFRRLYDSCRGRRFILDAACAVGIAMTEGQQWLIDEAYSQNTASGRTVLRLLPERTDPGVDNVRITLNRIRDITEEVASLTRIEPGGWEGRFESDPRDPAMTQVQLHIERAVWREYRKTVMLHAEAEQANTWRSQCGSGLIKAIPDRSNPFGWDLAMVPLDRILWDPHCKSQEPAQHLEWGDSCAWNAEDATKAYGIKFKKPDDLPTVGSLRAFDGALGAMRGIASGSEDESRAPGVLVTELYRRNWKTLSLFVHTGTGEGQSHLVWYGPNPYGACPYLKFDLGLSLLSPFGVGVPLRLKADQQFYNLALTAILRHLLTVSAVRWLYEEGTVTNPQSVFSPRVGGLIPVKAVKDKIEVLPQMIQPPNMNATAWQLAGMLPTMMEEKAHLRPVMFGITSPRGESGQAIEQKIGQAGRVYAALAENDGERVSRFLTHHIKHLCNTAPIPVLMNACGAGLQGALMERLQQGRVIDASIKVSLPAGTIQPRTAAEKRSDLERWAALLPGAFDPDTLKYEIFKQTGEPVTSDQELALANASEENLRFMSGQPAEAVDAKHFEPHDIHVRTHKQIVLARHTGAIPDEVVAQVELHILDHLEEAGDEAALQFANMAEGQGQLGATEAAQMGTMPETVRSGSMAAPVPTNAQYGARDTTRRAKAAAGA